MRQHRQVVFVGGRQNRSLVTRSRRGAAPSQFVVSSVVLTCLVVLIVAVGVPSVFAAREVARRSRCQDQLRQLHMAIANYEEVNRFYPPGCRIADTDDTTGRSYWHWSVYVLPYLGFVNAYDALSVSESDEVRWNAEIMGTKGHKRFRPFRCPTDTASSTATYRVQPVADNETYQLLSNYAGAHNAGPFERDPAQANGWFVVNRCRSVRDIGDGTSNVIAVGEKSSGSPQQSRAAASVFCIPHYLGADSLSAGLASGASLNQNGVTSEARSHGFSSPHKNGGYFAFGDGTVRWLGDEIDRKLYSQLLGIADGYFVGCGNH